MKFLEPIWENEQSWGHSRPRPDRRGSFCNFQVFIFIKDILNFDCFYNLRLTRKKRIKSAKWFFGKKRNFQYVKESVGDGSLPKIYRSSIFGLNIGPVIITNYVKGY